MQGNKNQNITVTVIGKGDVSFLPEYEQELLISTLLQRMIELARGGGK